MPPVPEPYGPLLTPSDILTNTVYILYYIDDYIMVSLLSGWIHTGPPKRKTNEVIMPLLNPRWIPVRRLKMVYVNIPPSEDSGYELPPQWMGISMEEFEPDERYVTWKLSLRAPPYILESRN